ncbi:MAG: helix-hairpin-helix domain-containing protein [Tannerellaceae bacterium]|jgi:hypothetical protein|nr:helix-hairpin-helix domain-containing protein [Tannerellaceae bacterium]
MFINSYELNGQFVFSPDKWMEYIEDMAVENENTEEVENLYNELSYLKDHPFELNSVTAEQLKKFPFLSDRQIENILSYREKYGKLVSIYELKHVKELDFPTLELLLPFVYMGELTVDKRPLTVDNLLKYNSNEVQIRYDKCFQQKKGYLPQPDSILEKYPNRQYIGEPFYQSIRYSFTFDDRLQIGFTGEKDAGEAFWNTHHKGYDHYSFYFLMKDIKWLKTLAVGDYNISFGQGLVVSNEFFPGKNALVTQAERKTYGFRRHFSTNENDYFRGAAATVNIKNVDISLFYSQRKLDANPIDSVTVSSIKTDGLHRIPREAEKKHLLPMKTFGGNIRYATPNVCVGITALSYSFGQFRIEPEPKPYNLFYFRGNSNTNASVDYLLKNRYIKWYGETAVGINKSFATLNGLQLTPVSYLSALLVYRYYDERYQAFFGRAFAQSSTVQNEEGLYIGMQFTPFPYWKIAGYADFFRFPWLTYQADAPSSGREYMLQADFTQVKNVSFYIRYKQKQKEKNGMISTDPTASILPYKQHRIRFQMQYGVLSTLMKTSVDGIIYTEEPKEKSQGIMLSQQISWKPSDIPFHLDLFGAIFHTNDYSSRIHSYENNILYAFNNPQFYGGGYRLSLTFRWKISRNVSLSAKLANTHYSDRDRIGTDLETIEGNNKTDINTLICWKF